MHYGKLIIHSCTFLQNKISIFQVTNMLPQKQTPVERIESLCDELVTHYADGADKELRVAAKMLLVSIDQFRQFGGRGWSSLVREYLTIAENDPEKFERILLANRSEKTVNFSA